MHLFVLQWHYRLEDEGFSFPHFNPSSTNKMNYIFFFFFFFFIFHFWRILLGLFLEFLATKPSGELSIPYVTFSFRFELQTRKNLGGFDLLDQGSVQFFKKLKNSTPFLLESFARGFINLLAWFNFFKNWKIWVAFYYAGGLTPFLLESFVRGFSLGHGSDTS